MKHREHDGLSYSQPMLRKVLWSVSAVGCLVIAFVVGGGSMASATQGQAVLAGGGYTETTSTTFCNVTSGSCTALGTDALVANNSTGVFAKGVLQGVSAVATGAGSSGIDSQGVTYGVNGKSTDPTGGWGLWGEGNDRGVYGVSNNEGVVGFGNTVGVRAEGPNIALRVKGKIEPSRSGVATVAGSSATPKSSVVVSSVALSPKSMVIATVQTNSGVWVKAAVPNVGGSSVTIYLNKAVTKSVPVAWMVIEQP